jgi:hypothetical protein
MEKAGTNRYRVTALGLAEADRLSAKVGADTTASKSPANVYNTVEPYAFHRVFLDYCRDQQEPRTWLGASAFLSLTTNSALALDDRLRAVTGAIGQALRWMDETTADTLRSGPVGGRRTIRRSDLEKLAEFVRVIQERFAAQMSAIRRRS